MKKHILTLALWLSFFTALAQKENNIWVGGGKSGLNFNSIIAVPFRRNDNIDFDETNASICDKNGNLLFYSNGCTINNRNFQPMQNGAALNIGDFAGWGYGWLAIQDGAAIIPIPGDSNKYYLFHEDLNYTNWDTFVNALMPTHLFYDVIDMSLDNGLGGIIVGRKDVAILSDTLISEGGFKLVKHANGRDYWLICHEAFSNRFYRFLIDPYGIHGPYSQYIGLPYLDYNALLYSRMCFNQKANVLIQLNEDSTAGELYDFDRCSGELSNRRYFPFSDTLSGEGSGEFSSSGQYFYVTTASWKSIWQFDVTASDIYASRKLVARYDGKSDPFPTDYFGLRLGPDSKIYVHAYAFNNSLHVINYPDSIGTACHFVENALIVAPPGQDWRSFPNIINYSLPALPGACDSLNTAAYLPEPVFTFSVYPNPVTDNLQLSISGANSNAVVEVYNLLGERVYYTQQQPQDHFVHSTLNLSTLSAGMYIVVVEVNGQQYERKVVKD